MNLDFNKPLLGADGSVVKEPLEQDGPVVELHLGEALARVLCRQKNHAHPVKLFRWAQKLFDHDDIVVDESDLKMLKKIIHDDKYLPVVLAARIEEVWITAEAKDIAQKG